MVWKKSTTEFVFLIEANIFPTSKQEVLVDGEYYKNLGNSDIKIQFLICNTDWLLPGSFEMFQKEAEAIFSQVPDAHLIVRIGASCDSYYHNDMGRPD